jgi:predicted nucleotidyltransferase
MRRFLDRDFLQTVEGYFFCVIGFVHPRSHVISYLKYIPDPNGNWGVKKNRFNRVLTRYSVPELLKTLVFLENKPVYIYDSKVMGIKMSAVPLNKICFHFKPEEKMIDILKSKNPDILQLKAANLAKYISKSSGVSPNFLGITGSLLLNIHRDFSDIDLIVYGTRNSQLVKKLLIQEVMKEKSSIRKFGQEKVERWCKEKANFFPLTYEEAFTIFKRKWNRGLFLGTMFSVHPVKLETERLEEYGDKLYESEGMIKAKAFVVDTSNSDFLPSIYKVSKVQIVEGDYVNDIFEVVSYEGLYGGIVKEGEKISFYGKLEEVIDVKQKRKYHRVLVGSKEAKGQDFIKPISLTD